jgi:hypothetical protein
VTDERDSPSDVALALVRELESEAELVDGGAFTFDLASARTKLAEFRLADPHAFVLLLVEAAHLLPGCSEIAFSIAADETRVALVGTTLAAHELQSLFDTVFVDLGTIEPESRRRELGRQRLALAIDAALSLPDASVELHASSADQREVVVNFGPAGQTVRDEASVSPAPPSLALVFGHAKRARDVAEQQRALLDARARYAKLPVLVDGRRVDDATPLEDVVAPVEIRDATGTLVGHAGWSTARTEPAALFIAHGVVVEELHELVWESGFVALVDADDLRRDLSLAKLVRDEAFAARVAAIHAVHDALPANATTTVAYASVSNYGKWERLFGALTMLGMFGYLLPKAGSDFLVLWFAISVFGLGAIISGWSFISLQLDESARNRALRAVGEIDSVWVTNHAKGMKEVTIAFHVSVPDRVPYMVSLSRIVRSGEAEQFKPGVRFHLRVHRNASQRVWLDVRPR